MRIVVYLICSACGFLAGYFLPDGAWQVFVSILVSYHLFLIWLVITAEHKTGMSLPIGPTILTHMACLAIVVSLGMGRNVIPYFGLIRYFIPAIAPFECTWLFSANPAKLTEEKEKEIPNSAEEKAAVSRAIAAATGDDYEAWSHYLAHRDPRLRKPGISVKEEYEQWMLARVKSRS